MNIEKCLKVLEDENGFPDGWISKFDFANNGRLHDEISKLAAKANQVASSFYEYLQLSVIEGDYIEIEQSLSFIKSIESRIDLFLDSIDLPDQELQFKISDAFLHKFVTPINNSLREYKGFIKGIDRKLKYSDDVFMFDAISINQTYSLSPTIFNLDTNKYHKLFTQNIKIATYDHNLSVKKEQLSDLLIIKKSLENERLNSLEEKIVIDKCKFLIKKILFKFKEDPKNYLYAFDFNEERLNTEDINIDFYTLFDEKTKVHNEILGNNKQSRDDINTIYAKILKEKELTMFDYHIAMKEYKDGTKSLIQVQNLNKEFSKKYRKLLKEKELTSFDQFALNTTWNYMLNNEFSLMLSQSAIDKYEITQKLREIITTQDETRIKNYFPFLRYANYLCNELDVFFKSSTFDKEKTLNTIDTLSNTIQRCYENYNWCKDKNFLAFQLPASECKPKGDGNTCSCFLASSFVLPINYEKVELELKELSRKLEKYTTLFEVHENVERDKKEMQDTKNEMIKSDKRSIEILGVFSAIVLFASTSVQIFSIHGITVKDALKFMLCFSYSLTLFCFLIWLITRESFEKITLTHKIVFGLLLLVSYLALANVINWWPFK